MPPDGPKYRAHVCLGKNCSPRGSQALLNLLEREVRAAGLADQVEVSGTSCRDRCDFGPSMNVYPGPVFYNYLDEEAIEEIVTSHFLLGKPVARYLFRGEIPPVPRLGSNALSALDRLFGPGDNKKP
jgi:(2Fe-2S) ferredoxin